MFKANRDIQVYSRLKVLILSILVIIPSLMFGQIESAVDSTQIRIGEQITYTISVQADSTDLVIFPEGQSFMPLEVIEFYKTDSLKENNLMQLVKQYALTQFDSGKYTIPQQKVQIGEKVFFTDSVKIEVRGIVVDTTKQKLYDIKPLIEVDRSYSGWWKILLLICLLVALVAGVIYWFFLRKKPMTEEEKIAILPPYERAKLALQKLDQSNYLQRKDLKGYYSDLTMIIRQYIDEKVYDHALESTTQELVDRLQLLKDGNQVDLDLKTIKNIETVLKRADLVKFAKSRPDQELAKLDRSTVDLEIDHVKEALPEPTEEEKLEDVKYLEELAQKRKRRRIIWSSMLAVLVVIGTYVGFGLFYGFGYMNDTILGHPSKTLLEKKEWVTSEYGAPGVTISTPVVLERKDTNLPVELQGQVEEDIFAFGDLKSSFYIMVSTTKRIAEAQGPQADEENPKADPIDLRQAAERAMVRLEDEGVQNIIIKNEQFITPNGQEGLKTHGLADIPVNESGGLAQGKYVHLGFSNEQVLQQIVMTWRRNDTYAEEMVERILSSIELLKIEEEE